MEAILEPVLTSFSLSLFLFVTSLSKKCMNVLHWLCVMHITYLLHLQVISLCCCSVVWAVAQCACIILAVLYEQMRNFTSVRNWHWKCGPCLFHLFWSVSVKACTHAVVMAYLRPHHCMLFLSLCWFVLPMSLVVFSQGVSDSLFWPPASCQTQFKMLSISCIRFYPCMKIEMPPPLKYGLLNVF